MQQINNSLLKNILFSTAFLLSLVFGAYPFGSPVLLLM
jgi:hypothetical protein